MFNSIKDRYSEYVAERIGIYKKRLLATPYSVRVLENNSFMLFNKSDDQNPSRTFFLVAVKDTTQNQFVCTCFKAVKNGFPCEHILRVFEEMNQDTLDQICLSISSRWVSVD